MESVVPDIFALIFSEAVIREEGEGVEYKATLISGWLRKKQRQREGVEIGLSEGQGEREVMWTQ